MFKNCVFKPSVDTKKWLKATEKRALATMAEAALAAIPTTVALVQQVNWGAVLSTAVLAGIITVLKCIPGVSEVESEEK